MKVLSRFLAGLVLFLVTACGGPPGPETSSERSSPGTSAGSGDETSSICTQVDFDCKSPVKPLPPVDCHQNPEEWEQWRDAQILDLLTPTLGHEYMEICTVAGKSREVLKQIEQCEQAVPALAKPGNPVAGTLANLKRFTAAVGLYEPNHDHRYAFKIEDTEYLKNLAAQAIAFPDLLKSQEFLENVSDPAGYQAAQQMIEEANKELPEGKRWLTLIYKSQFVLTPDNKTYGRFFVFVPGDEYSKWIQFGIVTPDMDPTTIHSVSVVGVKLSARLQSQVFLADYWRNYEGNQDITVTPNALSGHVTGQCYSCHKTPALPIYPEVIYQFDNSGKLVPAQDPPTDMIAFLDAKIAGYGPPNFGEASGTRILDDEGWGPSLGPFNHPRSDDFLAKCTQPFHIPASEFRKLRKYMNCGQCHNSELEGAINFPMAVHTDISACGLKKPLLDSSIFEGWMPPDSSDPQSGFEPPSDALTPAERQALLECLRMEYLDRSNPAQPAGILVDWLKGNSTGDDR